MKNIKKIEKELLSRYPSTYENDEQEGGDSEYGSDSEAGGDSDDGGDTTT